MPRLVGDDWRGWLSYAEDDRREALDAFRRGSWREVCFHSHQACEKLMKAILLRRGVFRPIHDLKTLAEEVSELPRSLVEDLERLTIHYYASRYPDAARRIGVYYNREEASKCLKVVEELWERVRSLLP